MDASVSNRLGRAVFHDFDSEISTLNPQPCETQGFGSWLINFSNLYQIGLDLGGFQIWLVRVGFHLLASLSHYFSFPPLYFGILKLVIPKFLE